MPEDSTIDSLPSARYLPWFRSGPFCILALYWVGATTGYTFACMEDFVTWCIPHLEGCTSISRTGRSGTSFYIFKFTMIPTAGLVFFYWVEVARWNYHVLKTRELLNLLPTLLGCLGAIALLFQMTFLGLECEYCRPIRTNSTTLCFLLTFFAQWLFCLRMKKLPIIPWVRRCYFLLCLWLSVELILFVTIPNVYEDTTSWENAVAWRSSYLISLAPAISAWGWSRSNTGNKKSYRN